MKRGYLFIFIVVFFLTGCLSTVKDYAYNPNVKRVSSGSWYRPQISTTWHYQLKGKVKMSSMVTQYHIDLFDSTKEFIKELKRNKKRVICYFSAGTYEEWRVDAKEFPSDTLGKKLEDWEGERWLDISSPKLKKIMRDRLDLAKQKGCDGVEPDNIDGFINKTGFELSAKKQLGYNKFIANEAHLRGLSVGLKNDLEQLKELEPFFDFAINEQCHIYSECGELELFIRANKPVFSVEYDEKYVKNIKNQKEIMCQKSNTMLFRTLILPLKLDGSFRIDCK